MNSSPRTAAAVSVCVCPSRSWSSGSGAPRWWFHEGKVSLELLVKQCESLVARLDRSLRFVLFAKLEQRVALIRCNRDRRTLSASIALDDRHS